MQEDLLTSVD